MASSHHKPTKGTGKRILRIAWTGLRVLSIVFFVVSLLAFASLELAPVRRLVVNRVNGILRSTFAGNLVIERIDQIGIGGIRGARLRIEDPSGAQVLLVDQATVRVSLLSTLRSLLSKGGDMLIDLSDVELGYVDANLDSDADGTPRLAKAFEPKDAKPSDPSARPTAVHLRRVALRHAWVHGQPKDAPYVDVDVDHLDLSVLKGSNTLAADLGRVDVITRGAPQGADLHARIEAHYAAPAKNGNDKAGRVDVKGDAGGIPLTASASIDGPEVALLFDLPKVTPEMVRQLVPQASLSEEVTAHAEAHGRLPDIDVTARVTAGRGIVDVQGHLVAAEEKSVHATIVVNHLDANALSADAPSSDLGVRVEADFNAHPNGDAEGKYSFDVLPGTAANQTVPAAHFAGNLKAVRDASSGETAFRLDGSGAIDEPGARTKVDFDVRKIGESGRVNFDVDVAAPWLDKTRLGPTLAGSAAVHAHGTLDFGAASAVDALLTVTASNVLHADQRAGRAWVRAHVRGPTDNPAIDAILQATDVAAGGQRFATAVVTAHGSARASDVTVALAPVDAPDIRGRVRVTTGDMTALHDLRVSVSRDQVTALFGASKVTFAGSEIRAEGVTVEGLGEPLHADARKTDHELSVRATTSHLDLAKLARLLRLRDVQGGKVAIDVDLAIKRGAAHGHVRMDLEQAAFARVKNGNAHFNATIEGRSIDAVIHARLGQLGTLDMDTCHLKIDGAGPIDAVALKKAWGSVALASQFDMSKIRAALPRGSIPLTDMQGVVRLKGEISRASAAQDIPDVRLSLLTRGLLLSGRGEPEQVDGTRVHPSPPWSIEGVDVELAGTLEKDTGATALTTRLFDHKGTLASLDARAPKVPYREWLRSKAFDAQHFAGLALTAELTIPRRELKHLPSMLKTQEMVGEIVGKVSVDGSLQDPDVRLSIETKNFVPARNTGMTPLDVKIDGRYSKSAGSVDLDVQSRGKQLLAGNVELSGRVADFSAQTNEGNPPWHASTRMRLSDFPLEQLAFFSDIQMKGRASGELTVDNVHQDARAKAQISFHNLELGRAKFPRGNARVDFDGRLLSASMRLDQTEGFVELGAQTGMAWGAEIAPQMTTTEPAFAALKADRFRAAAILPFVTSALGALDGRIDADARIDVKPGGGPPSMRGKLSLTEGRVQLVQLGDPFHAVTVRLVLTPDGLVRLEEATAYGSTGRVTAKAVARLNGFQFVGARASLQIPKGDPLPVDINGQDIGEVDGDVNVKADMSADQRTMNVAVDIPRLHTTLPLSSTHKAQDLGESKNVRIGYFRRPHQFLVLPMNAEDLKEQKPSGEPKPSTQTNIAIHLGNDVEIKRGTGLKIVLDGDPKIELTDQARMSGQIRLKRGLLEVQGKRFEIERGTVTFVGDEPSNPQIMVTAGWTAPDGTRVLAEFVGPLETGKVKLRSEPPRPQNEVLALIMFGTAEGSSATPYPSQQPDGATRAGTMAGGFATEGLSKGLDELTGLEISTKIDTTNSANPKPEIEVQIARDISMQLGYVIGTPPPGTNSDKTLLTLDWRFQANWSMEATFGDQGSSIVDFVWQYRY